MNESENIRNFYFTNKVYIDNIFNKIDKEINNKKYKVTDKDKLFKDLLQYIYNNSD